jgi:hypothetical protein
MRKRSPSFLFMLIMIGTIIRPMLAQHLSLDVGGDKVSKSIRITESYSLPVYYSYVLNLNSGSVFFVLRFSI